MFPNLLHYFIKKPAMMNLLCFVIVMLLCTQAAKAQNTIPFQGIARDTTGALLPNQSLSLRITIHDSIASGPVVYQETDSATTNALGLFTLAIGSGSSGSYSFSSVNWGSNPKFVQLELHTVGATYINLGTSQFRSVPYALYSLNGGGAQPSGQIPYSNGTGAASDALFTRNPASHATQISRTVTGGVNEGFTLGSAISGYIPDGPFFTRIDTPEHHYDYMGIGNVSAITGGAPNGLVLVCAHDFTGAGPLATIAIVDSDPVNTIVVINSQNSAVSNFKSNATLSPTAISLGVTYSSSGATITLDTATLHFKIGSTTYNWPTTGVEPQSTMLTSDPSGNLSWKNYVVGKLVFTPTTGSTINVYSGNNIINPASGLAALTIVLPSLPTDNETVSFTFTNTITSITYSGGTIGGAGGLGSVSPVANGNVKYSLTYDAASSSWF
jgi:hypothetical protein